MSKLGIKFQVTNVDKPLTAVSHLTAAGHEVWFGKDGGTVTNKANGKVTRFHVAHIWVKRRGSQGARDNRLPVDSRQ